jgi:Na+/H+-dicarboxylate symporter
MVPMKIWLKYLTGAALGIALSFALSAQPDSARQIIDFCASLALRIGRYMVIPLVATGCAAAVFSLRDSKQMLKPVLLSGVVTGVSSLLLAALGMASILIVRLPRVPVSVEKVSQAASLNVKDALTAIFPYSSLETLLNGESLLPAFVFACLIGSACVADKTKTKSAVTVLESLAEVFYICMNFIMDIMPVGMIALSCAWAFNNLGAIGAMAPLILLLAADFLVIVCVIYPLLFFLFCRGHHPYRVLYAGVSSVIAAFITGDTNYTLAFNIRHGAESLGIKRKLNGFVFPFFSIFSRGGSALVLSVSFILILRTYSPIGISFPDILWVTGVSFGLSFLLSSHPSGGAYIALAVLCSMYGRGFEAAFLLLRPTAPILCAFAAALDAVTALFGASFIAAKLKMAEHRDLQKFL